jgi:predicted ATPase/class 3 adenylate cyclase
MPPVPTGIVTFLFTDIEGSTRLWERQPDAMRSALARHDALMRKTILEHEGHVFKTIGDAFCAAFSSADRAVAASLAMHRALHAEGQGAPFAIRVRIACHTGSADERDGDYFGPTVNRVARLLAAGHGGQTLVSQTTWAKLAGSIPEGARVRDLGERRLKDLSRPEIVHEIVPAELPADFPALRTLDTRPNNLPARATALLGRERLLDAARALLRDPAVRLVTFSGPGGAGKTRLALQIAEDLLDEYEDGVWFVALAPVRDADLVAHTVLAALGLAVGGEAAAPIVLERHLREKETLLVLDNFEQVESAAPFVAALLAATKRLKVVVTSRTVLRVSGERDVVVPPLELPDATRLFAERAQALKPDFPVTAENAADIGAICKHLDGLPLAIELAAARVRLLSPRALRARLEQASLDVLTGGARDLPERQRTLRATIAWSYDLLDDEEKRLFRRFAVFARGATLEAVEAIGGGSLDRVESLVDKSLLVQEDAGGEARFSMLETLREFAAFELEKSGEAGAVRARHAEHFLALAEKGSEDFARLRHWLARFEAEHDNLRAAIAWALERKDAELALRLVGAVATKWLERGYGAEGRRAARAALALEGGSDGARGRALAGAAALARDGDLREARAYADQAISLERGRGDARGLLEALNVRLWVALHQHDVATGRAAVDEYAALATRLGSKRDVALGLVHASWVDFEEGRVHEAARAAGEALRVFREVGDERHVCAAANMLAELVRARGDLARALELYTEAREGARALGMRRMAFIEALNMGVTLACLGQTERACPLLLEVLLAFCETGARRSMIATLVGAARIAATEGDATVAARLMGASEAMGQAIGMAAVHADRVERDAMLALIEQKLPEAAAEREIGRTMGDERAVEMALELLRRPRA